MIYAQYKKPNFQVIGVSNREQNVSQISGDALAKLMRNIEIQESQ